MDCSDKPCNDDVYSGFCMSLYHTILAEAFLSTLWPLKAEVTAEAMRLFGGYDMAQAAMFSTAGAMLAALLLWAAGGIIHHRLKGRKGVHGAANSAENKQFFRSALGLVLLLVLWLPMGFAVALAAGFLRVPIWQMAGLGTAGCGLYYASMLMWI